MRVFFFLLLLLFYPAYEVSAQSQVPAAAGQPVEPEDEEDLLDFFLEAVEGVEPSSSTAPAVPPLPPSVSTKEPLAPAEPAAPLAASPEAPGPDPGWTTLELPEAAAAPEGAPLSPPQSPDPPSQQAFDPADPFNPPSPFFSGSEAASDSGPAIPSNQGISLGQGAVSAPSSPFWEDYSDEAGYPPPESAGNWIQLEVGQSESAAPVSAGLASENSRPTSIYSVPPPPPSALPSPQKAGPSVQPASAPDSVLDRAMNQAIQEPAPSQLLEPEERENLRKLFSDILPPEAQARASARDGDEAGVGRATPSPVPSALEAVSSSSSAMSRVGGLLSEPRPWPEPGPDRDAVKNEVRKEAAAAPPSLPEALKPGRPASGKEDKAAEAKPAEAAKTDEPGRTGAAPPAAEAEKPELEIPAEKGKNQSKAVAAKTVTKSSPAKKAKSGSGKSAPSAQSSQVAAAKNAFSLIIVNETGRDQVAQQYSSVLRRLGYKVSSAVEAKAGQGPGGQTLISYRPGYRAQAQAVSRYLPGKKTLVESRNQVLASEIMIHIR